MVETSLLIHQLLNTPPTPPTNKSTIEMSQPLAKIIPISLTPRVLIRSIYGKLKPLGPNFDSYFSSSVTCALFDSFISNNNQLPFYVLFAFPIDISLTVIEYKQN